MAQHYPVDLARENPMITRSLARIGKYLVSYPNFTRYERVKYIYTKEVRLLDSISPSFSPRIRVAPEYIQNLYLEAGDTFVISIGPYDLNPRIWGDLPCRAYLECHYGHGGMIRKVYYPC